MVKKEKDRKRENKKAASGKGPVAKKITSPAPSGAPRKRAEEELSKSRALLDSVIEGTSDAIYVKDVSGRYLLFNTAAEGITGKKSGEVLGKDDTFLFPPEEAKSVMDGDCAVMDSGRRQTCEEVVTTASGEKRTYLSTKGPLFDDDGRVVGLFGISRDITERKKAEEELYRSGAILKQAGEMASLGAWYIDISNFDDLNANPLRWTDETFRIFGYGPGEREVTNALFFERVHPDDRKKVTDAITLAIARKEPYSVEHRIIRPDRTEAVVHEYADILFDEQNRPIRIIGAVQDITERKRAEEALRESEEKFRLISETSIDIIFQLDSEGVISYCSPSAENYGYSSGEIQGRTFRNFLHPNELPKAAVVFQKVMSGEHVERLELQMLKKDGTPVHAELSLTPIMKNGTIIGIQGIARDITERKQAEEGLKQINAELSAVNRELEAFSFGISHDLKTPLRSIEGFTRAIIEDYAERLDETGKDYLRRVVAASEKMNQLIDAVLTMSRLTKTELMEKNVNLSDLAEVIAYKLQKKEPERQVEFFIAKGMIARGDAEMLHIVLENLFDNAWKFTSKHPAAKIEFGFTRFNDKNIYFVRDDGAGFVIEFADKLFLPFQRLHTASEYPGIGIGLAIVDRIIRRHGGRIWAEGAPEKGATFYFTLE